MKYIRIEGGIIEKSKIKFLADGKVELTDGHRSWQIDNLKIVKESDSIKELFDDFIIDANYKDKPYLYDRDEPVDSPEFDSEDEVVYGAIWTRGEHGEPILKPVAKLKKKGGWELL